MVNIMITGSTNETRESLTSLIKRTYPNYVIYIHSKHKKYQNIQEPYIFLAEDMGKIPSELINNTKNTCINHYLGNIFYNKHQLEITYESLKSSIESYNKMNECTCDSLDLFRYGCQCAYTK
jgi:hypothetical protein